MKVFLMLYSRLGGMGMSRIVKNYATLPWREGEDGLKSDVVMMSDCVRV